VRIIARSGNEDIATVFLAEMGGGKLAEFVESVQPPIPREEKWVLILSTLYGCPVGCRFCDAGSHYDGKVSTEDLLAQIEYLVTRRYPDRKVPSGKFKVQFARMGEPALNRGVLDVLAQLPTLYEAPGLLPCVSTIAPKGAEGFFSSLIDLKNRFYPGRFQLQFSVHTTDLRLRDWIIPWQKWDLADIAGFGESFYQEGDRKITLNFALAEGMPLDTETLLGLFSPEVFLIKITPVNPTYRAREHSISSGVPLGCEELDVVSRLEGAGYDVILSIGELEENHIGSNCGQHVLSHLRADRQIRDGYTYPLHCESD
jgi:23S rRNA (adenine2503-C2)-methyltransferase